MIKFKEMVQSVSNLYLVYEYCPDGNLEEFLNKKERRQLPERDALTIVT